MKASKPATIESVPCGDTAATRGPKKVYAKTVHLGVGLDLIGSKTSVQSKEAELEVTPMGVKMTSKKTNRIVLLPWANIKGCELLPDAKG